MRHAEMARNGESGMPLLRPQRNCWRIERAERVSFLIDTEDYFRAARTAIRNARHSVLLVGWFFHPETPLVPDEADAPNTIGALLNEVAAANPALEVRVLIWDMALLFTALNNFFPGRAASWFRDGKVRFRLDSCAYMGASHHQKILVVDDAVAFCGGGDFAPERWDSREHADNDPRRRLPSGKPYPPRHEVVAMVAGPAAAALGELARERWRLATGEAVAPSPAVPVEAVWPKAFAADVADIPVAVARTEAPSAEQAAVRENEALYLDSIASAKRLIFLENQYFTAPAIGAALAARLEEADGPEIVVICTQYSPGLLDGLCMDVARDRMIERLRAVDRHGRFHIYAPNTREGRGIIIHSKVSIIDDTFLRIGSCNIANRSMGFDTECDLAFAFSESRADAPGRKTIAGFRERLVGHYLDVAPEQVAAETHARGALSAAIAALDKGDGRRLLPLRPRRLGRLGQLISHYHLGDPEAAGDAWRPWRRTSSRDAFESALAMRKSTTSGR